LPFLVIPCWTLPTVDKVSLNSADQPRIHLLREIYKRTVSDRRSVLSSCTSLPLSMKIKRVYFKLTNFVSIKVSNFILPSRTILCCAGISQESFQWRHTQTSINSNTWVKEQVQCLWDKIHKIPRINDYVSVLLMIQLEHVLFHDISGHETTPNSWPCLSVFLTGYLTGAVLLTAYSGALTSFLSVQTRGEPPFRGFQGLLNEGSYRMGVTPGSAVDMFRVSKLKASLLT